MRLMRYSYQIVHVPGKDLTTADTLSRAQKKKPKIKQTTLIGPKEKGGLSLPDIDIINNALKATWIRRLDSCHPTASWTHIPVSLLERVGGLFLL